MEKKRILIVGAFALTVIGVLMVANANEQGKWMLSGKGWRRSGTDHNNLLGNITFLEGLGLPENASGEDIRQAIWEKELKDLGLTEDSTLRQYRQAVEARMQASREERLRNLRERMGLPENATAEDFQNAMVKWRADDMGTFRHKSQGHGYGTWLGKGGMGCGYKGPTPESGTGG